MTSPRLEIIGAAILFSTGGAAIKACRLGSWQVAGFRSGIAAAAIVLLLPAARKGWNRRTVLVAAAYAATVISFVLANKLTTALHTVFLQSLAPLYILVLSPWLLREPIRRMDAIYMAVLAVAMGLLLGGVGEPLATAPDPARGNILAALSGVFYALVFIGLRGLARGGASGASSSVAAVAMGNLAAFLICAPMAFPVTGATAPDWMILAFLGVFQMALGYFLLTRGLRRVRALEGSLVMLLEPVLNPIWAWIIQGETVSRLTLAGAALMVAATAGKAWFEPRAGGEGAESLR